MAAEIAVYELTGVGRARTVCQAMAAGIRRMGDRPIIIPAETYREPVTRCAVFYGFTDHMRAAMADHRTRGGSVYIDLGYWGRHDGGRRSGFHKVSVNSRHPTDYFQKRPHPPERFLKFGVEIEDWRSGGRHILIAGMSAKAAHAERFAPEQWERATIDTLRSVTDRPLLYRPKPNWKAARPLRGADYSPPEQTMADALKNCHAVVTHHSNVAVDALLAGIPVFTSAGVSRPMGLTDLARIENPAKPENRLQWAADVAFCQWSVAEMAEGKPWRHLKNEGLIAA